MDCLCSICEKKIIGGSWYCYACYKKYRKDIESKEPWIRLLQYEEKERRRKSVKLTYIGEYGGGTIWQVREENRKVMQ